MQIKIKKQSYRNCLSFYLSIKHHYLSLTLFLLLIIVPVFRFQLTDLGTIKDLTGLEECQLIGFEDASRNECGYCTSEGTNLPSDYGKDCRGICGGNAMIDCNGDCEGDAYIDPCTKVCIGGNTGITEDKIPGGNNRDCSQACFGTTPFRVNECNQCSIGGRKPPFQDCNGDCYAPNQFETMMARKICGQCVGGKSSIPISKVQDACGNCKREAKRCLCNGAQNEDICEVCGGQNDTCFKIEKFEPSAIPSNGNIPITVYGAFLGKRENIECLFKPSDNNEIIKIPAITNGNALRCQPSLKKGDYTVGVYMATTNEQATSEERLLVYENNANFTYMSPTSISYNNPRRKVKLEFQGVNLPPVSIVCIVNGSDWPIEWRIVRGKTHSCELPLPDTSQNVTITPSFTGLPDTQQNFVFTFFSPPVTFAQGTSMSEDKTAIIITFDRPVDVCDLGNCSAMLDDSTMQNLENDAKCEWATKQQLVIKRTKPFRGNRFEVMFKPNVLKEDNQNVAIFKNNNLSITVDVKPQSTVDPSVTISGPEKVPQCGIFSLVGHFTLPGEASFFRWTVWRADRNYPTTDLMDTVDSTQSATLTLDAKQLDFETDYTFELQASSESKNIIRKKTHTLRKMPYQSPVVSVISDPIPSKQMPTDQEIVLNAIITTPECFTPKEIIQVMWSIDNPRVIFNFESIASPVYKIAANSLPADTTVTFTARTFVGSRLNESSESSITLKTAPIKLEAIIEGSAVRTVGTENGVIELNSTPSSKARVLYQWSCEDQDQQPCYDYSATAKHSLLITRKKQESPSIQFHSSSLKSGQKLKFSLKLFSASDSTLESESSTVMINVINGSFPEVILKSVAAAGKFHKPNPATGAYFVPAGAPVILHAVITSAKDRLKSVTWDIIGSTKPFTYSVMEDNTYLSLGEDYLIEHGVYRIEVKTCDTYNSCGGTTVSLYATPRVSLCKLIVKPYTAFTQTEANVIGCSLSQDRLPLTYQMAIRTGTEYAPFTEPQFTDSVKFIGPPSQETIELGVEVCDRLRQCSIFKGEAVEVAKPENKEQLLESVQKAASYMNNGGNPLGALCMFFAFSVNNNTAFTKQQIEEMVSYMTRSISMIPFTGRQVAALYTCTQPLFQLEDNTYKIRVLSAIARATERSSAFEDYPKTSALNKAYEITGDAMNSRNADEKLVQAARKTQMALLKCVASSLPFGSNVQLGSGKKGSPYSVVYNKIIDQAPMTVQSKTKGKKLLASVSFSEEVKEKFTKWNCNQEKLCNGVVIGISFYPTKDPYGANHAKQLSPVLDVQMRTPGNGTVVPVQNIEDGIKIKLSLIGNRSKEKDVIHECHYWDEKEREWSKDGVKPIGVVSGVMHCWSSHLSSFTVLESANAMSTAAIAGIVVACLMALFILCTVVLFFVRKKQNKNIRVSTENLQDEKKR